MQRSKALFPGTLHPAGCHLRAPGPPTQQFCTPSTPLSQCEAVANVDVAVINIRPEEGVLPLEHYFCHKLQPKYSWTVLDRRLTGLGLKKGVLRGVLGGIQLVLNGGVERFRPMKHTVNFGLGK